MNTKFQNALISLIPVGKGHFLLSLIRKTTDIETMDSEDVEMEEDHQENR